MKILLQCWGVCVLSELINYPPILSLKTFGVWSKILKNERHNRDTDVMKTLD